jgi:predicted aspartyl protease
MISGVFRDGHPRIVLTLPGYSGEFDVEFIVDTGFEGDLTLPPAMARQLGPVPDGFTERMLADGSLHQCPLYAISLDGMDSPNEFEVLVLGVRPLLGTVFLADKLITIEATEGGDVTIEEM